MFSFSHQQQSSLHIGTGLLFNGLLCVFFAIAIFSAPKLLAYFVATLLMIIGVSLLTAWYKLRSGGKNGKSGGPKMVDV